MLFACWLSRLGYAATTCGGYTSLVKVGLGVQVGCNLVFQEASTRLPKLLRGLRRLVGQVRRRRLGWRALHQEALFRKHGVTRNTWEMTDHCLLTCAREGLLRAREIGPDRAEDFDSTRDPTCSDVSFVDKPEPHMIIMIYPAKRPAGSNNKVPVLFPFSSDPNSAYQAVLALKRTRERHVDGITRWEACNPLFLAPPPHGHKTSPRPATTSTLRALFKGAARYIGLDPADFGGHSGRIGGATDHFAAGTPAVEIQILGRWDSDIWQIYARQCVGATLSCARAAACNRDVDLEAALDGYSQPARVART
jgi:hypothetical protein